MLRSAKIPTPAQRRQGILLAGCDSLPSLASGPHPADLPISGVGNNWARRYTDRNRNKERVMKSEVLELLTEELKDAYSAEKQALRCMQKVLRKVSDGMLREGIQMHIEQTQVQVERVEQAMEKLNVRPGRKVCEAMRGL